MAASGSECDALEFRYRDVTQRKIQSSVHDDKRNATFPLVREAETTANANDLAIVVSLSMALLPMGGRRG